MNKILLPAIIAVLILSGCINTDGMIDCGQNEECFTNAAATCTPAKLISSSSSDMITTFSMQQESQIRGFQQGSCVFYMKILEINIDPTEGLELEEMFQELKDTEMTCYVPGTYFETTTTDELDDAIADLFETNCEGTYKDKIQEIAQAALEQMINLDSWTFTLPDGLACENGEIILTITNTGPYPILPEDIFFIVDDTIAEILENPLEPDTSRTYTWNCGSTCSPGEHSVFISTLSTTVEEEVTCLS